MQQAILLPLKVAVTLESPAPHITRCKVPKTTVGIASQPSLENDKEERGVKIAGQ